MSNIVRTLFKYSPSHYKYIATSSFMIICNMIEILRFNTEQASDPDRRHRAIRNAPADGPGRDLKKCGRLGDRQQMARTGDGVRHSLWRADAVDPTWQIPFPARWGRPKMCMSCGAIGVNFFVEGIGFHRAIMSCSAGRARAQLR